MAYRNIVIESPARISVKNGQLIVQTDGTHSIPIEDISALLLESERSTILQPHCPVWGSAAALFMYAMGSIFPVRSWSPTISTAGTFP